MDLKSDHVDQTACEKSEPSALIAEKEQSEDESQQQEKSPVQSLELVQNLPQKYQTYERQMTTFYNVTPVNPVFPQLLQPAVPYGPNSFTAYGPAYYQGQSIFTDQLPPPFHSSSIHFSSLSYFHSRQVYPHNQHFKPHFAPKQRSNWKQWNNNIHFQFSPDERQSYRFGRRWSNPNYSVSEGGFNNKKQASNYRHSHRENNSNRKSYPNNISKPNYQMSSYRQYHQPADTTENLQSVRPSRSSSTSGAVSDSTPSTSSQTRSPDDAHILEMKDSDETETRSEISSSTTVKKEGTSTPTNTDNVFNADDTLKNQIENLRNGSAGSLNSTNDMQGDAQNVLAPIEAKIQPRPTMVDSSTQTGGEPAWGKPNHRNTNREGNERDNMQNGKALRPDFKNIETQTTNFNEQENQDESVATIAGSRSSMTEISETADHLISTSDAHNDSYSENSPVFQQSSNSSTKAVVSENCKTEVPVCSSVQEIIRMLDENNILNSSNTKNEEVAEIVMNSEAFSLVNTMSSAPINSIVENTVDMLIQSNLNCQSDDNHAEQTIGIASKETVNSAQITAICGKNLRNSPELKIKIENEQGAPETKTMIDKRNPWKKLETYTPPIEMTVPFPCKVESPSPPRKQNSEPCTSQHLASFRRAIFRKKVGKKDVLEFTNFQMS